MGSPFPGMDPYLEDRARWPDLHLRLIAGLGDRLMELLRPRYVVRADERVYVADDDDDDAGGRPDHAIVANPSAHHGRGQAEGGPSRAVPLSIPTVMGFERRERFLSILARGSSEVVAVVEVLSPTNKRGDASEGQRAYLAKRRQVLHSSAHLVEIDLLRAGRRVPMARPLPRADFFVIVSRAERRPDCDVFPVGLRDRLPVIPVPLQGDEDVEVDLQALLDAVYERAGYDLDLDYSRPPVPPLRPEDETWAAALVQAHRSPPA